ncbi:MAG: phage adaptor protein [Cetobacterium sp.]|uniref:phage adaptor protein n=1 Tax=Cetobacterium sp. TaxID=2071632 RepID=UPI003EE7DAC1
MREISNYRELKNAVQLWLNRKDTNTISMIPAFINFAEKEFSRMIRIPYNENELRRTISAELPFIEIPQNFMSAKHFMVNGKAYNRVDLETYQRIVEENPATSFDQTGSHRVFCRVGWKIITYPALQAGDEVSMIFNMDIVEMTKDSDYPYHLIIAPDVMLYLSLRHAAIYLRDNEQEMFWAQKANDAAASVNAQLEEQEWSGSAYIVPTFAE